MAEIVQGDIQRELREALEQMPPPVWLVNMIDHYRRKGFYRPEDLRRLLGDPNERVELGPDTGLPLFLRPSGE